MMKMQGKHRMRNTSILRLVIDESGVCVCSCLGFYHCIHPLPAGVIDCMGASWVSSYSGGRASSKKSTEEEERGCQGTHWEYWHHVSFLGDTPKSLLAEMMINLIIEPH